MLTAWHFSSVASKIERGFAISREILLGRKWHLLIPDRSPKTCTDENMRLNTTGINALLYHPHRPFAFIEWPKHINSMHVSDINCLVTYERQTLLKRLYTRFQLIDTFRDAYRRAIYISF